MNLCRLAPICLFLLVACEDHRVATPPPPVELTSDAVGFYCSMTVTEHPGPKAQIFVADATAPLWFPSVRDMFAYTMLPEENQEIRAIYVSDTGASEDVASIAEGAWVQAEKAYYVLGSKIEGGMGLPEAVPFADHEEASAFADRHGGEIVPFDQVSPDFVFAEIGAEPGAAGGKL